MYTLVGHRGLPAQYPENTLISIKAAIQAGATAVEFDVQCSADGTAYVFHDENLLRLTGHPGTIYQHTDIQLQQLSAYYPQRFGEKFLGEPLCTLQQMTALLCEHPEVEVFIEPKPHSIEYFGVTPFMNTILQESACLGERRRIISFHYDALAYARQNTQACDNIVWVISDFSPQTGQRAQQLQPNTLCVDIKLLPAALPHWLNCNWMVYPMNDASHLPRYTSMNISYIETDDIQAILNGLQVTPP